MAATTIMTAVPSQASSAPLKLYEHTGDTGYVVNLSGSDSNLWWNKGFGDKISSVKELGSDSCAGYPRF